MTAIEALLQAVRTITTGQGKQPSPLDLARLLKAAQDEYEKLRAA